MKKLTIIGIVFASLLLPMATAQAKPTGMTKAQVRALMIREGLHQKHPVGQSTRQTLVRQQLEEIGAWAVPSSTTVLVRPRVAAQEAIIRGQREELRGLGEVLSKPTARVTAGSDGFDWNNAGIGAVSAAALLLGAAALVMVRRHHHGPLAH